MLAGAGGAGGSTSANAQSNSLAHHQTMFFGPAHTLTQYSSLPRRSHMHGGGAAAAAAAAAGGGGGGVGGMVGGSSSAFQRNTPIRRSTGIPEHHMEYFVPRSISEFNLSGVGDLALPPPRRYSPSNMGMGMSMGMGMGMGLPHGLQLGPPQTLICGAPPPPPPAQLQIVTLKPRSEKMVTFEDESKAAASGASAAGGATMHCPHGIPTTPRKSSNAALLGAGPGADIFM